MPALGVWERTKGDVDAGAGSAPEGTGGKPQDVLGRGVLSLAIIWMGRCVAPTAIEGLEASAASALGAAGAPAARTSVRLNVILPDQARFQAHIISM